MDLYRINDPLEAWDLGLEEYLSGDGVCVIEWADQAEDLFAEEGMWIDLEYQAPGPAPGEPVIEGQAGRFTNDPSAGNRTAPVESPGLVEAMEAVISRTITFGRHSPRYDSLLFHLSREIPGAELST
jgi:hypothetical protein